MREEYIQSRFSLKEDEWPPYQPKHYTTLALIYHKGRHTDTGIITVTQELVNEGNIANPLVSKSPDNKRYCSKDISELFSSNTIAPFILIEGAPGIGKTILSKEIAFQWARKKILKVKALVFLILLRDPNLKTKNSVEELLEYLLDRNIAPDLSKHLLKTKGEDLTIIFDGYDELSEEDRKNSLVARIINRAKLPKCSLVVTSRPTASLRLREIADCSVEILGFTEEDRLDYIQHALKGSDVKIAILQSYLQSNSTINALCYIPLNMTILLCIFEEVLSYTKSDDQLNTLPSTQTELYKKFIWMIIGRFLKKHDPQFCGAFFNIDILKLPECYNNILMELSHLAFVALQKDCIVFDMHDIAEFCPNLTMTSDSWNGLGLLKAAQFVTKVSFHFLHFSIQEYLAASYIAKLSNKKQIELLNTTFWNIRYFNTWIMYNGVTGGRTFAWKHFLSGNRFVLFTRLFKTSISKSLLTDKVKSLHLFQCFNEAGGNELVEKFFENQKIDLSNQTLLPKDIHTLGFFLLRSVNKHWKVLDLSNCNIGDIGCDILLKMFLDKGNRDTVRIDKIDFSNNGLGNKSVLRLLIAFKLWHTLEAIIQDHQAVVNNNLFEKCLLKFTQCFDGDVSKIVYVRSFVFAYSANLRSICAGLSYLTSITCLYLNNCKYDHLHFEELFLLLNKHNIFKIYIISKDSHENFLNAIIKSVRVIKVMFINDAHLRYESVDNCVDILQHTFVSGWMAITSNKILGNIKTSSEKMTDLKIFNLLITFHCLSSVYNMHATYLGKLTSFLDDGKTILHKLITVLQKDVIMHQISFCIVENDKLIANGVRCDDVIQALSSTDGLSSIYITNCTLNVTKYDEIVTLVSKQKSLSILYIYKNFVKGQFFDNLCETLWKNCFILKEVFLHSTDSSCTLTSGLFALIDFKGSAMFITNNTLAGQNTTIQQVLFLLSFKAISTDLELPTNFQENVGILNQILYNFIRCNLSSEILGFLMSFKSLISNQLHIQPHFDKPELLFYNDKFIFNDLMMILDGHLYISQIAYCIAENNKLIANGVRYDSIIKVLSSSYQLLSVYIKECNLSISEYKSTINLLTKQKFLSVFYIFDTSLKTQLFEYFCKTIWSNCLFLKEFFIHSTDPKCTISSNLLALMCSQTSSMLVTKDSFSGHKPNKEQISLLLKLKLKTEVWKHFDFQVNVGILYQLPSNIVGIEFSENPMTSEILHVFVRKSASKKMNASFYNKTEFVLYDSKFICQNLPKVLHEDILLSELNFCIIANNILIASGVKSDIIIQALSSNDHLISMFIVNCDLNVMDYSTFIDLISEQKTLSVLYIFECILKIEFFSLICTKFSNVKLKEVFIHSTDPDCTLNSHLLTVIYPPISIMFTSKNVITASHKPTSEQILLLRYLNLDENFEILYQAPESILGIKNLSTSKLLGDLMSTKKSISFTSYFNKLVSYKNFCFCDFATCEQNNYLDQVNFCITKNRVLIANRVKFDDIILLLASTNRLTSIIIKNCKFPMTEYDKITKLISKQKFLAVLYIFDSCFKTELLQCISTVLWKKCLCLRELCVHSTDTSCVLSFNLLNSLNLKRTLLITKNAIAGHKPSNNQILLLSHLNLKTSTWDFLNFQMNTGIFYQLCNSILGTKLTEKSSISEILQILMRKMTSNDLSASFSNKIEFVYYDNKFICKSLSKVLHRDISLSQFNFCIIANNILIASGVKSDIIIQVLSSNDHLISMFVVNCELNVMDYSTIIDLISEQKMLSILYILKCTLKVQFFSSICTKFSKRNSKLNEVFIHSIDPGCALNSYLLTMRYSGISTIFVTKNIVVATQKPTIEQISLLKYLNIHLNFKALYEAPESLLGINCWSTSELLDDLTSTITMKSISFNVSELTLFSYKNFCICNLAILEISKNCLNQVTFCIIKNNILIANGVKCDYIIALLSSTYQLTSIIIKNCEIYRTEYDTIANVIGEQESLLELYIFDSCYHLDFFRSICAVLQRSELRLKELFMHSTNSSCSLNSKILTSMCINTSTLFVTKNTLVGHKPNGKQILLSLKLEPNILVWNICTYQRNFITFYLIVDILTDTSKNILELNINDCVIGECEFEEFKRLVTCKKCILKWKKVTIHNNQTANNIVMFLPCVNTLEEIDLSFNRLQTEAAIKLLRCTSTVCLTKLDLSHNNITDKAADNIANYLSLNVNLVKLNLSYNKLHIGGVMKIFEAMKNIFDLTKFVINNNSDISIALFNNAKLEKLYLLCSTGDITINSINNTIAMQLDNQMASYKTELKEIDLSYNYLQASDTTMIFARLKLTGLTEITFSRVPRYAANSTSDLISHNITLKEFYLSHEIPGLIKSMTSSIKCLAKLHINHCNIHQRATDIAELLCQNKELQELNLSHNNLQTADIITIVETLYRLITNLNMFNVSNNNFSDQAAESIAVFLSQNAKLEEIDLSCNNLQASGLMKIVEAMTGIVSNLTKFNVNHNDITDEEKYDIYSAFHSILVD